MEDEQISSLKTEVAVVKAQVAWMAPRVERIESKIDTVSDRLSLGMGKIFGASAVVAVIASLIVEWIRG